MHMDNTNTTTPSPQASYRDITAKAKHNLAGMKRYWFIPIMLWFGLVMFSDALGMIDIDMPKALSEITRLEIIISITLIFLALLMLLGQQRVALKRWQNNYFAMGGILPNLRYFLAFDAVAIRFFALQLLFIALLLILLGFLWLFGLPKWLHYVFIEHPLAIIFIPIAIIVFFCLGALCHYLSYGVVDRRWSPLEAFTLGISSLKRHSRKIGMLWVHITLSIFKVIPVSIGFFVLLLYLGLRASPPAYGTPLLLGILCISIILIIRVYAFFELVIAGLYLQDTARATPELTEAQT